MESFFHTMKTERVHHRANATRGQARRDLFQYIEGFYNPAACTQPWAISAQKRRNAERLSPVHFFGGRSLDGSAPLAGRNPQSRIRLVSETTGSIDEAARVYQGQTTNFRTHGGGFAPVFV